jgi:hypothetical protein
MLRNSVLRRRRRHGVGWLPLVVVAGVALLMGYQFQRLLRPLLALDVAGRLAGQRFVGSVLLGLFCIEAIFAVQAAVTHLFQARDLPLLTSLPLSDQSIYEIKLMDAAFLGTPYVPMTAIAFLCAAANSIPNGWVRFPLWVFLTLAYLIIPIGIGALIALLAVRWIPWRRVRDLLFGLGGVAVAAVLFGVNVFGAKMHNEAWRDAWLGEIEVQGPPSHGWALHRAIGAVIVPLSDKGWDPLILVPLAILCAGSLGAGTWAARRLYLTGRSDFPAPARKSRNGSAAVRARWTSAPGTRPGFVRAMAHKEWLEFRRDPHYWGIVILPLLLALSVIPLLDEARAATGARHAGVIFQIVAVGAAGLVAGLTAGNLALPTVGKERAWWVLSASGLRPTQFLVSKLVVLGSVAVVYGLFVLLFICALAKPRPEAALAAACWVVPLSLAEVLVSLGIAARYPDFQSRSLRRAVRPLAGILGSYLLLAITGLAAVVAVLPEMAGAGGPLESMQPRDAALVSAACGFCLIVGCGIIGWNAAWRGVRDLMYVPADTRRGR